MGVLWGMPESLHQLALDLGIHFGNPTLEIEACRRLFTSTDTDVGEKITSLACVVHDARVCHSEGKLDDQGLSEVLTEVKQRRRAIVKLPGEMDTGMLGTQSR